MKVASRKAVRLAMAGFLTSVAVAGTTLTGAGPALAGNCSIAGCGVVRNDSAHPVTIADWCDGAGSCGTSYLLKPGEVSTKYKRDTDTFALQCTGNYYRYYGDLLQTSAAYKWIRISDGNSARVVNQNC
ncbi:hypothetical protein ACTWLT_19850 [Micromonospora sp. ZYX-F-536]|uniref:hypothetical protein n=1 Tax=Micromonospora sp. ZYX-F-536 TaxID=3457629 RepID=UPI0040409FD2